jgi:hypothetical protein
MGDWHLVVGTTVVEEYCTCLLQTLHKVDFVSYKHCEVPFLLRFSHLEMSHCPMWRFLNRRRVIKGGDFSPRHTDNSDRVSDEESQASDKFHCASATTDTKKAHLCNESYLSSCLFHCASSVASGGKVARV